MEGEASSSHAQEAVSLEERKQEKIPVTILTGFLGAGKTTLLNHILKGDHGFKFAVIENEYGDVGVDQDIIQHQKAEVGFQKEEIVETVNGCICCNVRGDISKVVKKLVQNRHNKPFSNIIIETTGLADPGPVAETFYTDVSEFCTLDGIITVVDAKYFMTHLNEKRSEGSVNETVEQVAFADRIILNKIDLVNEEELKKIRVAIKEINGTVDVIETTRSKVCIEKLINIDSFKLEKVLEFKADFAKTEKSDNGHGHGHGHGHHNDCEDEGCDHIDHQHKHEHNKLVGSISIVYEGSVSLFKLDNFFSELLQAYGDQLYRYKGVISVAGKNQPFIFNGVHMNFEGDFLSKWKEGETRVSRFCLIGRELDRKIVEDLFSKCKTEALRFKLGDEVQVNVDDVYVPGKVDSIWDEGCVYRIKLDNPDEDGEFVWAPDDTEQYIKQREESISMEASMEGNPSKKQKV